MKCSPIWKVKGTLPFNHRLASAARGWKLKGRESRKINFWTALEFNDDFASRIRRYRCSTLFKYDSYLSAEEFFDWIEWPEVFVQVSYIFLTFSTTTISRFWIFWGRGFIVFDERGFFFLTGTTLVPVQLELVPSFGLLPSSLSSATFPSVWDSPIWKVDAIEK